MDSGYEYVVGANFAQRNSITNDTTKRTLNHQNDGRCKFAIDIIISLGFVISGALAVAAYIQFSPILLFPATVVAIASVGLLIIRCMSNRKRVEVVNDKDLKNEQHLKSNSIHKEKKNITKSELAVDEKPVIHLKEEFKKSFFESSESTQEVDTPLTDKWTEEVHTELPFAAKSSDPCKTLLSWGLPPFVVPNTSDTSPLPGDLPPTDLPPFFPTSTLAPIILPAQQEQNRSSSSGLSLSNDKTFAINGETTDCSVENKVNTKKGLYEDVKANSSTIILPRKSRSLNPIKALPITPPRITRNVTQPSISSHQDNDFPPTDLPPVFSTIILVPKIALVLQEQIDTEKTFRKNMVCGATIIQKIIDHELENKNICDPLLTKVLNYYKTVSELSLKLEKNLKKTNRILSEIAEVFKSDIFLDYRQILKEIILNFGLFDQMVSEIIKNSGDLKKTVDNSILVSGIIGLPYGAILQAAIKRMSQHEMILNEALEPIKQKQEIPEVLNDLKILEGIINDLQKNNKDTNLKQTEMQRQQEVIARSQAKFNELYDKIILLKDDASYKLNSKLELEKSDFLNTGSKRIRSMGSLNYKKDSDYLKPAERLGNLISEINKLAVSPGIKKEKIQVMAIDLSRSEWAKKIIAKDKTGDLGGTLKKACEIF